MRGLGRVLVLGGTGFIGSAIARRYAETGTPVRVLARSKPEGLRAAHLGEVELVLGDVADQDILSASLEDVSHVVYAVGRSLPQESTLDPVSDIVNSLPPLLGVLEALRVRPGTSISYLSSGGTVYGNPPIVPVTEDARCDPITGYGITKLAAEKYVGMYARLYGLDGIVLRIANAYGPMQPVGRSQGLIAMLLDCLNSGRRAPLFGNAIRDYVFVDDIADAVVELTSCRGRPLIVNVGTGVGYSVSKVVQIVERIANERLAIDTLPARPFDVEAVTLDTSRLRSLIAWNPRTLEDGIATTWTALARDKSSVSDRA